MDEDFIPDCACRCGGCEASIAMANGEIFALRQELAQRASGDPAVRDILLYEFGTTDPALLKDVVHDHHQRVELLAQQVKKLLHALSRCDRVVRVALRLVEKYSSDSGQLSHAQRELVALLKEIQEVL